ncbi:MAG: cytochrome d ubiquinol oxidase subunit II [Micrococcales bacterium]|nr:cytochrome d ubiquinol oxidase subunit II [Micrococcales bacterium]
MIAPLAAGDVDPAVTEGTAQALVGLLHNMTASPSGLQILWFALIAVLWAGYLVLEGFDFGVGMLLPFVAKKNAERRTALTTIGPFWDGNQVWLLTAGGATFAAFPEWYATLFPAAYLALFLILLGLIVRAVGFEYRGKVNSAGWRRTWDWCIILGSWIPAVLWGVAFANLVAGARAAVDPAQIGPSKIVYDGNFWNLVFDHNGFLLLGGATTAVLFMAHGAQFLSLKTDGAVRKRAEKMAWKLTAAATVVAAVWVVWLGLEFTGYNHLTIVVWAAIVVAALALIASVLMSWRKKFGFAFTGTTVALLAAVVIIFGALFPNVINGSQVKLKGDAINDPIVGYFVLNNVGEDGLPVAEGGRAPTVTDVVNATVNANGATVAEPGKVPDEAGDVTVALTNAVLADVLAGNWPAGAGAVLGRAPADQAERDVYGPCSMPSTKAAVDVTFQRVVALVEAGAITPDDITVPLAEGAGADEALALTDAVLAGIADGSFGPDTEPLAGVLSWDNAATVVVVTLTRVLGSAPSDAVVGSVVADIASGSTTIGGLPAEAVRTEVGNTVRAALGQLNLTIEAVVGAIPGTLQAVADQVVAADKPGAAEDRTLFGDGMDLSDILVGDIKGWDKDKGLANLNGRIANANGALQALHVLGYLEGDYKDECPKDADGKLLAGCTETLKPFEDGAVITGQTMMTSSSSPLTLKLMTWVAVILTPIVLGYQAWSIWTFRKRISAERIPAESGLEPADK